MSCTKMLMRVRRAKKVSIIPTVCIALGVIVLAIKYGGSYWLLDKMEKMDLRRAELQLTDAKAKYHGHDFLKDVSILG